MREEAKALLSSIGPERDAAKRILISEGVRGARGVEHLVWIPIGTLPTCAALDVLAEVGDARSVFPVWRLLWDLRVQVRRKAAGALRRISERMAEGELRPGLFLRWQLAAALPRLRQLASQSKFNAAAFEAVAEDVDQAIHAPPKPETKPGNPLPIPSRPPVRPTTDLPVASQTDDRSSV